MALRRPTTRLLYSVLAAVLVATPALAFSPDGTYPATERQWPQGNNGTWFTETADFNGDGLQDVVRIRNDQNVPSVFLATDMLQWQQVPVTGVAYPNTWSYKLFVADFDGDGDLDIKPGYYYGDVNSNRIWFNDGQGHFTAGPALPTSQNLPQDVDGDGNIDWANWVPGNKIAVAFGDGAGTYTPTWDITPSTAWSWFHFGDMDNDGDIDLMTVRSDRHVGAEVYLNDGADNFVWQPAASFGAYLNDAKLADLNGDGFLDFVSSSWVLKYGPAEVWFGNGDGTFTFAQELTVPGYYGVFVGDLDDDGDQDIALGWDGIFVYPNEGNGVFGEPHRSGTTQANYPRAADLNADGALDLYSDRGYNLFVWHDSDGDGTTDNLDNDDDNDGVNDDQDAFPKDASESGDNDGDGIGDNADTDDDNDGVHDDDDAFPFDASETSDNDGDGVGDNADPDDDNDGVDDTSDLFPTNPDRASGNDNDGDGVDDEFDGDDDNDGVHDDDDAFPFDASESSDNDGDGIGDNADTDDDNDGVADDDDAFPFDASESNDNDGDGIGDNADTDDDNDGVADDDDAFPFDATESNDNDGDGVGDNADPDDDNDGIEDHQDPDADGDGDLDCTPGVDDVGCLVDFLVGSIE